MGGFKLDRHQPIDMPKSPRHDATVSIDWPLAQSRGLGEPCQICGDQSQLATHAAPCCHSACSSCWASWSQTCMFCNAVIPENSIIQAPTSIVPQQMGDNPAHAAIWKKLDEQVRRGLDQLVLMKHAMTAIQSELESVLGDLEKAPVERGARNAVMQVAAACVVDQMQRLHEQLTSKTCFTSLNQAAREMESIRKAADHRMDALHGRFDPSWVSVCQAQWQVITQVCTRVIDDLLPTAVAIVFESPLGGELMMRVGTLMSALGPSIQQGASEGRMTLQRLEEAAAQIEKALQSRPMVNEEEGAQEEGSVALAAFKSNNTPPRVNEDCEVCKGCTIS